MSNRERKKVVAGKGSKARYSQPPESHSIGLSKGSMFKSEQQSERFSMSSEMQLDVPITTSLFHQYDTDGFDEMTMQQIRYFLQKEKRLYLTDENILNIMSSVLMQTDHIKLSDFSKLCSHIFPRERTLRDESSVANTPEYRYETSLCQPAEQEKIMSSSVC